jgi:hypothetical protein
MNSYKLNGIAGHTCRKAICESLKIRHFDIYKVVKNIDSNGVIETGDGAKFKLKLEKI